MEGGRAGHSFSPCPPHRLQFVLWLISEVACHCGELQKQLPGSLPVPVAAAGKVLPGKVLQEGNSQHMGSLWNGAEGILEGEGNAFLSG